MPLRKRSFVIVIILVTAPFLSGCEPRVEKRVYEEMRLKPKLAPLEMKGSQMEVPGTRLSEGLETSPADLNISWETPEGWQEKPGEGMRLVSFQANGADGSIVSLSGPAGGLEANIERWMEQINLSFPNHEAFHQFLESQKTVRTQDNQEVLIVDFTQLQNEEAATPSMLAGILRAENKTIFVKLSGSQKTILSNKDQFIQLCQSLRVQE